MTGFAVVHKFDNEKDIMKRQKEEVRMFKLVCRTRVRTFRFGGFSLAFGQYCPNLVKSLIQANIDLKFIFSKKATKIDKIFTIDLTLHT